MATNSTNGGLCPTSTIVEGGATSVRAIRRSRCTWGKTSVRGLPRSVRRQQLTEVIWIRLGPGGWRPGSDRVLDSRVQS